MPSTVPDMGRTAGCRPADRDLKSEWAERDSSGHGFWCGQVLCWESLVLELLWVALPLIWRWYHCSKHFWNCPLGIASGAGLGHTGKSISLFYFIATPSLWPKMVLPSLMTHLSPRLGSDWLACEPKLHPPMRIWIFTTTEHISSNLDHFAVISHWPKLPLSFVSLL